MRIEAVLAERTGTVLRVSDLGRGEERSLRLDRIERAQLLPLAAQT